MKAVARAVLRCRVLIHITRGTHRVRELLVRELLAHTGVITRGHTSDTSDALFRIIISWKISAGGRRICV